MKTATAKQRRLLGSIYAYQREHGEAPRVRDLMEACGHSSTATVTHKLNSLARKGYLAKERYRGRGLEILPAGYVLLGVQECPCPTCGRAL